MPYTEEQIVELAAVKVQAVVLEKVQTFTDGVEAEVQKLRLEMKDATQFNSAIQKGLNEMKTEMVLLEPMKKQVAKLYTLFCENGYMQKFNALHASVNEFFRTRFDTCPVAKDVREMRQQMTEQQKDAVRRAEGKLRTREDDQRAGRRWKVSTFIAAAALLVSIFAGIIGRALGWW